MRFRDTIICFGCIVLAGILLVAASTRLEGIHHERQELGLVSNTPLENAPPSLAFATVAMGAFRGLVVDILWMRADKLKEEGLFFDAKQLADWITVLQPRFAGVWDFHAWNMAYNISVSIPASQWQERWRWVRNGYELLRDKGIEKNPHSIILYRSLAWIFQHKISGVNDDCHRHYKRELALAMRPLIEPCGDEKRPTNDYFRILAQAEEKFSQIARDPEIAEFIEALKTADEAFADEDAFVSNYMTLRQMPGRFSEEAFKVIDRFRQSEALKKFHTFAQAYLLRNVWKFDIDLMQRLNEKYGPAGFNDPNDRGPLNWEHADVHAMYWGVKGLETAGKKGVYTVEEKNTDRIVFHSLQSLYRKGKMILYPVPGELHSVFLRPDLQMFDSCNRAWIEAIEKYEAFEKGNPKAVRGGHKNMLENAVELFYRAGRIEKAKDILAELRRRYPQDQYKVGLVEFVRNRVTEEIDSISSKDAIEQIMMSLREAYFRFAVHDDDVATGRENWAKEIYSIYQRDRGQYELSRVGLPEFGMIRYLALVSFVQDEAYPEYMRRSLLGRIQVERPELFEKLKKQEDIFEKLYMKQQQ